MNDTRTTKPSAAERYRRLLGGLWGRDLHDLAEVPVLAGELRELVEAAAAALAPNPFGAWLDAAMRERDLGHGDIASASHHLLRAGQILDWRSGRCAPTFGQAVTLANAIGAPLVDVLGAAGHGHIVVQIVEEWNRDMAETTACVEAGS